MRSGKVASTYIVRCGAHTRCAKVYKYMGQRSFQRRERYQEGRRVRSSRQARAMGRKTHFGRKSQEEAWKTAEMDALMHLTAAGVRVPVPYGFFDGVLLMELIVDANGDPAPDLGEVGHSAEQALSYHRFLMRQIVVMLSVGIVHGDPELVQHRAEIALQREQFVQAEALAERSYVRGPRLGALCRRNWATIRLAREMRGDAEGAAAATQRSASCTLEPPVRM
jgi:hypothetical protein